MSNDEIEPTAPAAPLDKLSDWNRFKKVGAYHGIAFLAAVTLWGTADAWAMTSGLLLPHLVSVGNAIVAGSVLAILFHEWGHFAGARLSRSYSPMVRTPKDAFIFGFNFDKNSQSQFLAMSIGGPMGNWLLVALVLLLVPIVSWGSAMLLAVVASRAISVTVFEGPVIARTLRGGKPDAELEKALTDGSGDRGKVIGLAAGALIWLVAI